MKTLRRFYIVDVTAESVVGGFDAPNFSMASRIFCEMLEKNEKLKKYEDSYKLRAERNDFQSPETYDEVVSFTESCDE